MSWLSKLFGGRPKDTAPPAAKAEDHKGFVITPAPIPEGGQFRVAARIEKDGRSHDLVRADTMASLEQATAFSLAKARQVIDEQGDGIFAPR